MNPTNDFDRGVAHGLMRARSMAVAACEKCRFKPALVGCVERRGEPCPQYETVENITREIFKVLEGLAAERQRQKGAA